MWGKLLCLLGFHKWGTWEHAAVAIDAEGYQRICLRCGAMSKKRLRPRD